MDKVLRLVRDGEWTMPPEMAAELVEVLSRLVEELSKREGAPRDFFTVDEFAKLIGRCSKTVGSMMDDGELPWALLGSQRVVLRAQLLAQLAERAREATPRRRLS
jgi:hypothetical protein